MKFLIVTLISISSVYGAIPTYDSLNRLIRIENTDGSGIDYTYDDNGNLTNRTTYMSAEIIVFIDPPGSGIVTGAGNIRRNTTTALTAIPGSAFDFINWTDAAGTILSSDLNYLHTVVSSASLIAHFTPVDPPHVTIQPIGGHFTPGSPFNVATSATGRGPLNYTWRHNGTLLPAEISPSLSRQNSTFLDAGTYSVEVKNPGGTTTSSEALVIIPIPSYSDWRNVIFSPAEIAANNPALIGADARIAPDGITNLLRFALGSKDRSSIPVEAFGIKLLSTSSKSHIFVYNRLIGGGGLEYKVGVSSDLLVWDNTEANLESLESVTANSDGITERMYVALKEPMRSSMSSVFFRLNVSEKLFQGVTLTSVNNFNYSDAAATSVINSESGIPGLFESASGGVLVKSNYYRSGGTIITKDTFNLQGKTVEFIWEGSGNNSFMQPVCGSILNNWLTDPGTDNQLIICTFGNSWAGSWVASPGITYKTTICFTSSAADMVTINSSTGAECGRQHLPDRDFSVPQRLYIRLGDTQDNANAFILLKSLSIKSTLSP